MSSAPKILSVVQTMGSETCLVHNALFTIQKQLLFKTWKILSKLMALAFKELHSSCLFSLALTILHVLPCKCSHIKAACDNMKCIYSAMIVAFRPSNTLHINLWKLHISSMHCALLAYFPPCCLGLPDRTPVVAFLPLPLYLSSLDAAAS